MRFLGALPAAALRGATRVDIVVASAIHPGRWQLGRRSPTPANASSTTMTMNDPEKVAAPLEVLVAAQPSTPAPSPPDKVRWFDKLFASPTFWSVIAGLCAAEVFAVALPIVGQGVQCGLPMS